ncbi:MAG: hypothetical protein WAO15_19745 [Mycobacterium sp.]
MRVATSGRTQRIRSELDETIVYHQHDRLAKRTRQHAGFADSYHHATVHRIIDMPTATAGR